jgi:hypothetical protein
VHSKVTRRAAILVGLLHLVVGIPATGQEPHDWRVDALRAVVNYRTTYLGDTLAKLDLCRFGAQHGGEGAELRARLAEYAEGMLWDCDSPADRAPSGNRHLVYVDSVARRDAGDVFVRVTVSRGEYVHREDFSLVPHQPGFPMGVREVRLWGAGQAYPRRPIPSSPTP